MTTTEADRILNRAREAQAAWAALEVSRRCSVLGRLRREIALNCEAIAERIARETGKPAHDALSGDVLVTLEMLRYCETHASRILRSRRVGKPALFFFGSRFRCCFEPYGVALIFSASNYPLQLAMAPMASALAAGNAVVLKGSERTPETNALIEELCAKAQLPSGLVQVVQAGPAEAGALIEAKPDIVFSTGSSQNGRAVAERAARHLIPTILELGGKDAALVFADCRLDRAVEGVAYGAFSNSGRVCIGVKRLYVEASIHDEFVLRLKQRMAKLRVSNDADADLCPLAPVSAMAVRSQIEDACARGARIEHPDSGDRAGYEPTMLSGVARDARILTEECFGPVICVATFQNEAHAVELANGSAYALSSSVWTGDRSRGARVAAQLSAGSCAINDVIRMIANPYAGFGGNRQSGYGRYHGPEGLRAFSRTKTVMTTSARTLREITWFPFEPRTSRLLTSVIRFRHASGRILAQIARLFPIALFVALGTLCHVHAALRQVRP